MKTLESVLTEKRTFTPPAEFVRHARTNAAGEAALRKAAADDFAGFWAAQARTLRWRKPFTRVLDESQHPFVRWFDDGELNLTESCLDQHLGTSRRNKAALIWEGEPGETRVLTYFELHREVCRAAAALQHLGVQTGDRVVIYMPMIPELVIAVLACARLGATHSVIFGGFSAEAIRDRVLDAGATTILTADGGFRRGKVLPLKGNVDEALKSCPAVRSVVVVRRTGGEVPMVKGRDHLWTEVLSQAPAADFPAVAVPAEHPLFILYTSGTTGKPKGVVHSTGGYGTQVAFTMSQVFDLRDEDTYFCTADVGWVTGHSYLVYGPLIAGATVLMYEGAPDTPHKGRFWELCDKWGVTILYTAPTAIRSFMRWGDEWPKKYRLDSLRLLGSVGEPINPAAWSWYHEQIGKGRCPIVDTWWQTETGAIMVAPLPGSTVTKPGSCTRPLPGIALQVVHKDGTPCRPNEGGYLVVTRPWPAQLRTVWGDPERYRKTYFGDLKQAGQAGQEGRPIYFTGDGARFDEDGYLWVMGRVDDVLNVAGHRIGTAEVESALVSHPDVAEAAVVGRPDELKGQAIVAFVTLRAARQNQDPVKATQALKDHVVREIGALARPDDIRFTEALPKTRSGKIMRRLLREIATSGHAHGDVTTLEDMAVLQNLSAPDTDEE